MALISYSHWSCVRLHDTGHRHRTEKVSDGQVDARLHPSSSLTPSQKQLSGSGALLERIHAYQQRSECVVTLLQSEQQCRFVMGRFSFEVPPRENGGAGLS
jgi:hypothetical protein